MLGSLAGATLMAPRGYDRYMIVVGAGRNRKFVRFTDSERCAHFFGVLSIAAQAPKRGYLLISDGHEAGAEEIANEAAVSVRVARATMDKLKGVGVLLRDESVGAWRVHDWDAVNPAPGSSTERMRRKRDAERDANVTRNRHQNVTESVTEVEVEVKNGSRGNTALVSPFSSGRSAADEKATDEDRKNCRLLAEQMKAHNPRTKVKSKNAWLRDMRLLRERDGNPAAEIAKLIRWLFSDPGKDARFWADVIQSPDGLREHYATLWQKMTAAARRPGEAVEDSAAFLARREGAA